AASRTSQIIEDSGAKLVLTNVAHDDADDALPSVAGNDLAYVMYTSGSTGRPKGVMVEHRGMVNHCFAKLSDLDLGEDGVLAQNGPPTFDIVVWQCLAPLATGGRVVVFPDDVAEDPSKLLDEVEARGVTALQLVPSMLRAVLDEAPRALTTLRWIVPTGEALPTTLCRRWLDRYPHIPLLNTYGSTECSDDQCHYVIRSLTPADDAVAIASIGTPIHNMTAHVLDANLAPVPAGVAGDLYIGGIGVGRGYINDPERTAAAFIPDPFSNRPNARLYRTRDLARRRADGNLDFLGRVDAMIKLRGFRIEPGEIEAALAQHPSVAAAAVIAREHPSRERVLVAYIVARAASADELRQFLGERLPQYMVPTAITFLDALPLTANGKLDARQLPAPQWEASEEQEIVAPRTPAEEALAAIWAEVLGLERVGVTQDFFAIGGDSIKSIQIVARSKRAGLEIRPSDLFQHPTIAALAPVAKHAIANDAIFLPEQDTYPLSPMQEGMLFHTISAPSTDVYVQQLSCRLAGELRVYDFERAWQTIVQRHAVLRTAFEWRGLAQPQQVVSDRVRVPLEVMPAQDIDALCASERSAGFDLRQAPLMRLKLVRVSEREHQLIWTWHHIILDAWSVPIIMEELFALYGGQAEPPRSRPYHDFVAWQKSRDLAPAETFWRGLLADFKEPTPIAIEHPGNAADGYGLEFLPISDSEADALRAAARHSRLTLNTLLQGAWALLLSRYSGRDDVVFGTAVAGRPPELTGVERMVGLLINTIPTRVRIAPDMQVGDWLDELQRAQAEARRFEHAPLVQVQGWSGVARATQLFDSLLVFENVPLDVDRLRGSGLDLAGFDFVERANFPLTVMMEVRTSSKLGVGYDRSRFDRASMLRMLAHLRTLLARICEDPERRLRDLDPIAGGDDWSRELYVPPVSDATITELFEAQVSRTPDAIAAIFAAPEGDVSLTYRRLNEEAERVAQSLRSHGVVSGDRVAICMVASLERLASILGALKAGAAYVPLDTSLPAARREEMIADSGARVVLGERTESRESLQSGIRDLAYIIYTSGSTGSPKGVAVTHRSLRHLVDAQIDAFQITNESRVLQFASLGFDASVSEIFTALLAGARLYMAPRNLLVPSREMLRLMERWAISVVTLPPSVLARLPESGLPALRTLVSAGEACPADLAERWSKGRRFLNAYGPTEITVCASIAEYRGSGKPSIGRPMGGARIYIVDEQLRRVPAGVAGEMLVGGPGVAHGYWNRPELTAASFIDYDGERVYRTGDIARFLPNREIEFLGRRDDQVKVHGFRIEPGEIESALRDDPSVCEAAIAIEGDRIVAYVVPNPSPRPEWWPSIAEYFVYDDLAYHAMTSDERRNESYRAAIRDTVRGKVVVEVGTGPEAILSRFCAEAGARKVYAIEMLPETFDKACKRVRELGLDDRIEMILGDATNVALPEPAEVCVSEIVGAIGGSEGAAIIMNGVRHLLRDGAAMIPRRSTTLFAPVQLPDSLFDTMTFSDLPARYVERIFAEVGHAFDLRLCVKGIGPSALLAEPRVFEDLDYSRHTEPEVRHRAEHVIARAGRLDGFLVWLTLDTGGGERIDILEHEHCWLPVFFPLNDRVDVRAGDRIESLCGAIVSGDAPHPDYFLEGTLTRGEETMHFRHDAPRHGNAFRATPFYQRFFADDVVPHAADTRQRLRKRLPEYMLPDVFIQLEELPLLPSGKLDRRALPSAAAPKPKLEIVPPRSETERAVARIWQDILEIPDAGLQTNFFDHGGHSLLLLRVQDRIKEEIGVDVSVTDLFNYPTVESLAGRLTQQTRHSHDDRTRQRVAARQQALGRIASRRAAELKEESQ
ncbi:MAG: amino acid adenylation domain-containing protein, partial [Thermoanaerobaculia bacterium]